MEASRAVDALEAVVAASNHREEQQSTKKTILRRGESNIAA